MSIIEPAAWYAKQDFSKHYVRDTSRPFEEGVSRGQLRAIDKCGKMVMFVRSNLDICYPIIAANRKAKGRVYGMTQKDLRSINSHVYYWHLYNPCHDSFYAAAICVRVKFDTLYCSAWGHVAEQAHLSPVCFLAKSIYNYCADNKFYTLDIGIGGEPSLDAFKTRLGFTLHG